MVGILTDAITRQVQGLVGRLRGIAGSSQNGEAPAMETGASVNDGDVLGLLEGDAQWSQQFQERMGRDFEQVADRALDYWMDNTDRGIRNSLGDLAGALGSVLVGRGISNRSLVGLGTGLAEGLLTEVLTVEKTRSAESDRSSQAGERYRASRGQIQAEMARQLSRGQRYL